MMVFKYPEVIQQDSINVLQRIALSNNNQLNSLISTFKELYPNYANLLKTFTRPLY